MSHQQYDSSREILGEKGNFDRLDWPLWIFGFCPSGGQGERHKIICPTHSASEFRFSESIFTALIINYISSFSYITFLFLYVISKLLYLEIYQD